MGYSYSSTKLPTATSTNDTGHTSPASLWANTSRITADDSSDATWGAYLAGQGANIVGSSFGFQQLPDSAVIDGIEVYIDGSQTGCYGTVSISGLTGVTDNKDIGALSGNYGGPTDLWGADSIDLSEIASLSVSADTNDVSGGDGIASMDYMSVTLYWHIEVASTPTDVNTRFDYKVFSRDGDYLGLLPNVTSKFGFTQDINSAGSSISITCGKFINNEVSVSPLLDESGNVITTEDDLPILATETDLMVTTGDSPDQALFKNSNRVAVWMYNKYYPNGKLMFAGQINRVDFKYGTGDTSVKITVYSDGLDLNNFIARGYPFAYTNDVVYNNQNGYVNSFVASKGGWQIFGQSFTTGAGVTNIGAITVKIQGTATVTLSLYDGPNGNLLASVSKSVSNGSAADVQFEFSQLVDVDESTEYFFAIWMQAGQSLNLYRQSPGTYTGGSRYTSIYGGGSGGGSFVADTNDLYFITKSGTPTTTTTYTSDDPVSDMASNILLDYNNRGGYITERDFDPTGLSLTYTFVVATILDALKKILELCPTGYYFYIDLGTAEIDINLMSETADYTVVRGRHINELSVGLSIEQIKNYLLLSGGDTGGGVNLYRDYKDAVSVSYYGQRTSTKSDNRITLDATADALGTTFIDENASETQETTLILKDEYIDITQFTPGKTVGFANFGNIIDNMVLQIVRREVNFSDGTVSLTLGRLPVRMNDEIQRINRDLLNEQTINNPSAPN